MAAEANGNANGAPPSPNPDAEGSSALFTHPKSKSRKGFGSKPPKSSDGHPKPKRKCWECESESHLRPACPQWIEKQKIKSSWRAQKRREGLGLARQPQREEESGSDPDGDEADDEADDDGDDGIVSAEMDNDIAQKAEQSISDNGRPDTSPTRQKQGTVNKSTKHWSKDSDSDARHPSRRRQRQRPLASDSEPKKHQNDNDSSASTTAQTRTKQDDGPSVRELFKRAYAPAALHTFKADPLHRRKGGTPHSQATGTEKPTGRTQQQRGGQPNMKLRMEAMLAKIKRDYT